MLASSAIVTPEQLISKKNTSVPLAQTEIGSFSVISPEQDSLPASSFDSDDIFSELEFFDPKYFTETEQPSSSFASSSSISGQSSPQIATRKRKRNLQKSDFFLQFSIRCPESGCRYIACSNRKFNLKGTLCRHIFNNEEHSDIIGNCSKKSLANYVDQNCTRQERLKKMQKGKTNKKNIPKNAYYTVDCPYCPDNIKFRHICKSKVIGNFNSHVRRKHKKITKEKIKDFIEKHLKKPEWLIRFSICCPELECKKKICSNEKVNLKSKLFNHISNSGEHQGVKYSKESLNRYVDEYCQQEFLFAQNQLGNIQKRTINEDGVPIEAYYTIICTYCFREPKLFYGFEKRYLLVSFKRHMKKEHSDITREEIKSYIEQNLKKPELLSKFSVLCPESGCKHIAHDFQKSNLKRSLRFHMLEKHQEKETCSEKFLVTYVKRNYKIAFSPVRQ
ncbi:MAG TPA: hypothetical protein ENI08_00265 [Candidatus Dependentiae bacterium]|nr:hypothetical protein [Candidatus Dependentiae bacterium]